MNTRRQFLITAPLGVLGRGRRVPRRTAERAVGATPPATPGAPPTFGTAPASGPPVSAATFAEAEKLAQVTMSPARARDGGGELAALAGAAARAARRAAQGRARRRDSRPRRAGIRCSPARGSGPARDAFVRSTGDSVPLPANDADIAFAPVTQLSRWIEQKPLTSERLTNIYLRRIEQFDPKLRSRHHARRKDLALAQAKQADAEIAAGKYRGPLHGIPYGVKDLLDTAGIATTYGAEPFRNRVPADRLRGRAAPERRRRGAGRQAESRRAGAQRHLVRRPDDEPVAARGRRVGIERGSGRGDRGGAGRLLDRQRNRRQHRRAGDALRRHRPAADVRTRAAHGRDDALLVARQARADDAQRRRRDARAAGDHRARRGRCVERPEPPRLRRERVGARPARRATSPHG